MTSYVYHELHHHWQLCLFTSQYTKTRRKTIRLRTTDSLWGETTETDGISTQRASNVKSFHYAIPAFQVYIWWKHNFYTTVDTYARPGIPSNWQLYCLFNKTYRKNARQHQNDTLLILSEENPLVTNRLASQRASNAKSINHVIPGLHIYLCVINIMEKL